MIVPAACEGRGETSNYPDRRQRRESYVTTRQAASMSSTRRAEAEEEGNARIVGETDVTVGMYGVGGWKECNGSKCCQWS